MLNVLERILRYETPNREGPITIASKPAQPNGDDKAIDVHELALNDFIVELCHLIARESRNSGLRLSYETMLQKIHHPHGLATL
jgi:hypothetical protein